MTQKPFTSAHATLIEAEQGGGKSITATARIITDAINHIIKIINPMTGEYYDAEPISKEEKNRLKSLGYKLTYDTVKIHYPDKIVIAPIPDGFSIVPSIRIFANYHLYGVRYNYLDGWGKVIKGLDEETISDGRLALDEYNIGASAREGMTALGKAIYKYNFSLRKRRLDIDIMIAHQRLAEWTSRLVITQWISCKYEPKTGMVTLTIKAKGNSQIKEFSYNSSLYRKYFDTEELFRLPAGQVAKAIAQGM